MLCIIGEVFYKKRKNGWNEKWVMTKCKCGSLTEKQYHKIKNGSVSSCSSYCTLIDRTNHKPLKINSMHNGWTIKSKPIRLDNSIFYICLCKCGREVRKRTSEINKHDASCYKCSDLYGSHGLSKTTLYSRYQGIVSRCYRKYDSSYERYGGRGITVCQEWLDDFLSFYNWAINNGFSEDLTIDRIDNNKGYSPSNCRWVDIYAQANNKRNTLFIKTIRGSIPLGLFSRENNLIYHRVFYAFKKGLSVKEIKEYAKTSND